ncbi:hypothetical protein GA0116948_11163 [Chitinophaga costaii]|uniref:Uncharacterized protein n=1 Tax=Chitinophaga costaii TaxID=1335309 RepID=A0A1C4F2Z9_9BACT|nr:hypothetical protein GA0116948_11163 [Chitinophaga costaii]
MMAQFYGLIYIGGISVLCLQVAHAHDGVVGLFLSTGTILSLGIKGGNACCIRVLGFSNIVVVTHA